MSLHFNWSRLDETCAEALRQLVNKRLAEVVERVNAKSGGDAGSAANAAGAATSPPSSCAAPHHVSASAAGTKNAARVSSAVSSPLLGGGFIGGGNPILAEPSMNISTNGSAREVSSSFFAASGLQSRSPCMAAIASGNGGGPASGSSPATAGTMAAAASQYSINDVSGVSVPRMNGASVDPTGGGDAAVIGDGDLPRVAAPFGANVAAPTGTRKGEAAAPRREAGKVPPLVYLEVGSLEWGTTPPFVEIVAFKNATEGPPGYHRIQQQQRQHHGSLALSNLTAAGSHLGDGRDISYALSHGTSPESMMPSSTALASFFPSAAGAAGGVAEDAITCAPDNHSESSQDFTVSPSATGVSTPHVVSGAGGFHTGMASVAAGIGGAGQGQQQQQQQPEAQASPVSLSQFPSQPEASTDMLASLLGPGGLHIRFHITYGGALHLSLSTAVQHELRIGAVALRVSLPMLFYLANLDLDCYLCINVKDNLCQVWLEHGPLSSSVVNRLSITATFGGDDALDGGGVDYGASSTEFYSRFGSSSISDDGAGEGGSGAYVNEHEVSQFVLHELRAILKETIMAPHCITIPISFSG